MKLAKLATTSCRASCKLQIWPLHTRLLMFSFICKKVIRIPFYFHLSMYRLFRITFVWLCVEGTERNCKVGLFKKDWTGNSGEMGKGESVWEWRTNNSWRKHEVGTHKTICEEYRPLYKYFYTVTDFRLWIFYMHGMSFPYNGIETPLAAKIVFICLFFLPAKTSTLSPSPIPTWMADCILVIHSVCQSVR